MTAFQASRTISIRSTHLDVGRSSYIQNPLQAVSYASICQLFMVLSARLTEQQNNSLLVFLRKEVIQPHLPIRLPCYDFTPVTGSTFDSSLQAVIWIITFVFYLSMSTATMSVLPHIALAMLVITSLYQHTYPTYKTSLITQITARLGHWLRAFPTPMV